jgi:hypothetical protein
MTKVFTAEIQDGRVFISAREHGSEEEATPLFSLQGVSIDFAIGFAAGLREVAWYHNDAAGDVIGEFELDVTDNCIELLRTLRDKKAEME